MTAIETLENTQTIETLRVLVNRLETVELTRKLNRLEILIASIVFLESSRLSNVFETDKLLNNIFNTTA